jgi:hypothetical protein
MTCLFSAAPMPLPPRSGPADDQGAGPTFSRARPSSADVLTGRIPASRVGRLDGRQGSAGGTAPCPTSSCFSGIPGGAPAALVQLVLWAAATRRSELLEEALNLSVAIHSTRNVSLCLAAFARLAFEGGQPEQAALLMGAAEALGRRAGLRAWPTVRRGGAELVAQPARRSGRTGSTRCSPPAPGSTSARQQPPSTIGPAPARPPPKRTRTRTLSGARTCGE